MKFTKEQCLNHFGIEIDDRGFIKNDCVNAYDIYYAMQEWEFQEKKKEAIAFLDWYSKEGYLSADDNDNEAHTTEQLYESFTTHKAQEEENRLIVLDRRLLLLIEKFMGYADGYLSEIITWNDLMPVVEKIQKIDLCRYHFHVDPFSIMCIDYMNEEKDIFICEFTSEDDKLINRWYKAVIQFIQWFNTAHKAQVSDKG